MLLRIDDDHRVPYCTLQIFGRCTTQGHVSNQVRDDAHLFLLFILLHQSDVVRITFRNRVRGLRIEVLQSGQRIGRVDANLVRHRDCHDSIAVKVCTRQTLSHLRADANCVLDVAEIVLATGILVVHRDNGNLKRACMRVTNQCKLRTVLIRRAICFGFFYLVQRKNNFCGLTRKRRSFKRHGRSIALFSKVQQHLFLDSRISVVHDFVILGFVISSRQLQLLFDQRQRLLRKELGRNALGHIVPVAFPLQLIDGRKVLFAIFSDVGALAFRSNGSAKRIARIVLDLFEHLHLRCARRLVRVEHNINTIRHIVRIHGHALQIVAVVHHDTNLCIMRVAQIQICNATANLNNAIFCKTALIAVAHCYTVGAQT